MDFEQVLMQEAEEEGRRRGEAIGFENGRKHGRENAHDVCFELGFAQGVAEACKSILQANKPVCKASTVLEESISRTKWTLQSPQETDMQQVRTKFKVLDSRASLGISPRGTDENDMSF